MSRRQRSTFLQSKRRVRRQSEVSSPAPGSRSQVLVEFCVQALLVSLVPANSGRATRALGAAALGATARSMPRRKALLGDLRPATQTRNGFGGRLAPDKHSSFRLEEAAKEAAEDAGNAMRSKRSGQVKPRRERRLTSSNLHGIFIHQSQTKTSAVITASRRDCQRQLLPAPISVSSPDEPYPN